MQSFQYNLFKTEQKCFIPYLQSGDEIFLVSHVGFDLRDSSPF
jgi:hypothetical protein